MDTPNMVATFGTRDERLATVRAIRIALEQSQKRNVSDMTVFMGHVAYDKEAENG